MGITTEAGLRKGLTEVLPTSVQKSYFMLSDPVRTVLNTALEKYRSGQSEPILVGGENLLKPALRLMTWYRLVIEEIKDAEVITSYTRWVDAVQVRGAENQEVYLTFSPRFERIWLESNKRLLEYVARKVLGLESVKDEGGKIIKEAPLPVWANLRIPRSRRSIRRRI
jgi:hypothetical protein